MFIFDRLETILSHHLYKKKSKVNLLEDYVNFVDTTMKQNKYFQIVIS